MNEILLSNNHLFLENDKFIVDNMLTDEDLDLDLNSNIWQEICSSDSNSSSVNSNEFHNISLDQLNSLTPPETPTSSDSASSCDINELSSHSSLSSLSPLSPLSPFQRQTHHTSAQQTSQVLNYNLSNVTLLPAMVNMCPSVVTPVTPYMPNAINMIPFNNNNNTKTQLSQIKREARKLRNREAASISRKKKKDYVDNLQNHVNVLMKENSELKLENEKLKCKISDLEKQNRELMKQNSNSNTFLPSNCKTNAFNNNKKAALSLLAVVFMLGINLKPFTGILTHDKSINGINFDGNQDLVRQKQSHGASRSLLWQTNENDANVPIDVISAKNVKYNSSYVKTNCKTYINQTESLRMESDLRGWLLRLNKEKEVQQRKKRIEKTNIMKDRFNKPFSIQRLKAWMQRQAEPDISDLNDNRLDLFKKNSGYSLKYEDLLSAIHRRDDTFYFLSYSYGDHLIIPPITNNGTEIRPRFSILMPSFNTLNESSRGTNITYHQIAMMQIDCEVINTKMVQLNNIILSDSKSDDEQQSTRKIAERTHNRKSAPNINTRHSNRSKLNQTVH